MAIYNYSSRISGFSYGPRIRRKSGESEAAVLSRAQRRADSTGKAIVVSDYRGALAQATPDRNRNPSRRLTKLQKLAASTKRGKERRVAAALKKFLHAQNPAVKYDGAAIVKLKGGAVRITPIKAKRGRR